MSTEGLNNTKNITEAFLINPTSALICLEVTLKVSLGFFASANYIRTSVFSRFVLGSSSGLTSVYLFVR